MRIAVAGATGTVGRHVVAVATERGHEVVPLARAAGVDATQVDVRDWTPPRDTGGLVTNAVLQWVPEHPDVLRRWTASLAPGLM